MNIHIGQEWLVLLLGMTSPLAIWAIVLIIGGIATLIRRKTGSRQ